MKKEEFFEEWKGDWKERKEGRKNFIPIKPNFLDISEIKQVLKKHSESAFKYKKE